MSRTALKKVKRGRPKKSTIRKEWPRIRVKTYESGAIRYVVDGRFTGADGISKGSRQEFETRTEAEVAVEQALVTRRNDGLAALGLSADLRRDALKADSLLREAGRKEGVLEVVEGFLDRIRAMERPLKVEEAIARLLAEKETAGRASRYLNDLRGRLGVFARCEDGSGEKFGIRMMDSLTGEEVSEWVNALAVSGTTKANYRRVLDVLFNFGVRRKAMPSNPLNGYDKPALTTARPGLLSPRDTARLLYRAMEERPELVPALALNAFAGLRPEAETARLDWTCIDFPRREIHIRDDATKGRAGRFIPMTENLVKWLRPHRKRSGSVLEMTYDRYNALLCELRCAAGIIVWPPDCLRHGFGSYGLAAWEDEGAVMHRMGHSNVRTFRQHYRNAVRQADARKFWRIVPPRGGIYREQVNVGRKIVDFSKARSVKKVAG